MSIIVLIGVKCEQEGAKHSPWGCFVLYSRIEEK